MAGSDYVRLVDDIRAKGLVRPITTYQGMVLDERHRYKACIETGTKPRYEEFTCADPAGFVYCRRCQPCAP